MENKGILYIVATPIGNPGDITIRAIETLRQVDIIACENYESNRKRLMGICGPLKANFISYYDGNEYTQSNKILEKLRNGQSVALVSSAGTPLLCDPGYTLVQQAIKNSISIIPIPGASSLIAALVCSGAATFPFAFFGFFPKKNGERISILNNMAMNNFTTIYFESSHRIREVSTIIWDFLKEKQGDISIKYPIGKVILIKDITKPTFDRMELNQVNLHRIHEEKEKKYLGEWVIIFDKCK